MRKIFDSIELYRRKVSELQSLLCDEITRTEAMDVVRGLIDRIEVRAGERRGAPDVVLVGALARIRDFASSRTTTASPGGGGGRVLLVAGARNSRFLRLVQSVVPQVAA